MDRSSRVRCTPGSSRTGAVLALLLVAIAVDSWPWGSDLSCPPAPEPVCPSNPADDTANYFPHPTDCHYYIQCDGSRRPICRRCGPFVYFSPKILNCLWPLDAKCEHNATTRQDSLLPPICGPDRPPHFDCDPEGSTFPDPSSCDYYFMCIGGWKEKKKCPAGKQFDDMLGTCCDPSKAGCQSTNNCRLTTSTTTPRSTSTTSSTPRITSSTSRITSSTPRITSTTPRITSTTPRITSTTPLITSTTITSTTPRTTSTTPCPTITTPCTTNTTPRTTCNTTTCTPCVTFPNRECDNSLRQCPVCQEDGQTFAHPLNCDWYYICQNKVAVPTKCGCGFLYNTKYNVCDYPCNVECQNRVKRATQLKMFCQQNSRYSTGIMAFSPGTRNRKCGQAASY